MKTVVYVDVLIAVNILVTYIMIVCSRVILKSDTHKWGVLLAVFLGILRDKSQPVKMLEMKFNGTLSDKKTD